MGDKLVNTGAKRMPIPPITYFFLLAACAFPLLPVIYGHDIDQLLGKNLPFEVPLTGYTQQDQLDER